MIRRAFYCPGARRSNLLLAIAMGSATILLGCGGGGGGGGGTPPTPGVCGSSSGSTATVVCGYVRSSAGSAVSNATVTFEDPTNHTLGTATTNATGFYKFDLGSHSAALMKVEAPTPFYSNTMTYGQITYAFYVNAQAGGECIPAISFTQRSDTLLGTVTVYDAGSPPPLPAFPCPR